MQKIIYIFFFTFFVYPIFSQDTISLLDKNIKTITNNPEGIDFWLCFQRNFLDEPQKTNLNELTLELFLTSNENTHVNIEIDGIDYKNTVFLYAKTVTSLKIPQFAQVVSDEIIEKLGVHINSDNPISVYALNRRYQTTDTYLVLPTKVLGTSYRVMCYTITEGFMSQFAIVSTENNTEVIVTPNVTTTKHKANTPFKISLNKGEVYQVVANSDLFSTCDLTGSLITSNKKIAVFSGHQCAYVPPRILACNHLIEQMPPISSWGKHFYIGKLQPRQNYTYRVLASEDLTKVFEDTSLTAVLNKGQFYEKMSHNNIQISANKPVLVAQYSNGYRYGDSIGDPMMLLISPTQQFLKYYRFATPVNGYWRHYINVVVPTNAIQSLKLNDKKVDTNNFEPLGLSRYSIAYLEIPFGTHTLECSEPFGMYSYGFGFNKDAFDAYGNMGGQSFFDYLYPVDSLPPLVDIYSIDESIKLIIRDDRVDDTGLKRVLIIENDNLKPLVPPIETSSPQVLIEIFPKESLSSGYLVLVAEDESNNKSYYSLCYNADTYSGNHSYSLTQGTKPDCSVEKNFFIGIFGKANINSHKLDFSSTGNIIADNSFSNDINWGGYGGVNFELLLSKQLSISARFSLDSYYGSFDSQTNVDSSFDEQTSSIIPFQENINLKFKSLYLNSYILFQYNFFKYIYFNVGINYSMNLLDKIEMTRSILIPEDFYYGNGSKSYSDPKFPNKTNSLNNSLWAAVLGSGLNYPITKDLSFFMELNYSYYFTDLIKDGKWNLEQLSLISGIKFKI